MLFKHSFGLANRTGFPRFLSSFSRAKTDVEGSPLRVDKLTGSVGAVIRGIDLKASAPDMIQTLRKCIDTYHVVVLPEQLVGVTTTLYVPP